MGEGWGVHGVALPLVNWESLACPHLSLCGPGLHMAVGPLRMLTCLSAPAYLSGTGAG